MMTSVRNNRNPWLWIPTLYFAEGLPYFIVNNISVLMLTKMGVNNTQMALFTSLLYLPWTIKPFWSPFVDIVKTKRWWIVAMQILMSVAFVALTLTIPTPSIEQMMTCSTPISLFTLTLLLFVITAFASATHDIAADGFYMIELSASNQSAFVGIRSTFYRISSIFGQGALVWFAGHLELTTQDVPLAWRITLLLCAVIFSLITLYHVFFLPRPLADHSVLKEQKNSAGAIFAEFGHTFYSFFTKKGIVVAILFMLLFRLPEALLLKICIPFLVDARSRGGLGMATEDIGFAYGTIGVLALTFGGILGGLFIAKYGLKKSIWWMTLSMTLPDLVYVYFADCMPDYSMLSDRLCIISAIAVEQFGYGFGFTAYMLYMIYFSEGESKTSHYALCTAFMALSMMLPGAVAGYLQSLVGYSSFFWIVIVCCLAPVIMTAIITKDIDSAYAKKIK